MLAVVPAVALGAVIYGRRVRKLSREVQDALGTRRRVGEESLVGIRTVRAFAAEPSEAKRYGDAVDQSFELAKKRNVDHRRLLRRSRWPRRPPRSPSCWATAGGSSPTTR